MPEGPCPRAGDRALALVLLGCWRCVLHATAVWLQALFCKDKHGLVWRWCSRHGVWEHPDKFRGARRSCLGHLFPGASPPPVTDVAAAPDAADTAAQTNTAAPVRVTALKRGWSKQVDTGAGEYSEYAAAQIRRLHGEGVAALVQSVTGKRTDEDGAIRDALHTLVMRGKGGSSRDAPAAAHVDVVPLAPSTCAGCGLPTAAAGFVGKSLCLTCAAGGKCGLALTDVNHALVTGHIRGRGAPPVHQRALVTDAGWCATQGGP